MLRPFTPRTHQPAGRRWSRTTTAYGPVWGSSRRPPPALGRGATSPAGAARGGGAGGSGSGSGGRVSGGRGGRGGWCLPGGERDGGADPGGEHQRAGNK